LTSAETGANVIIGRFRCETPARLSAQIANPHSTSTALCIDLQNIQSLIQDCTVPAFRKPSNGVDEASSAAQVGGAKCCHPADSCSGRKQNPQKKEPQRLSPALQVPVQPSSRSSSEETRTNRHAVGVSRAVFMSYARLPYITLPLERSLVDEIQGDAAMRQWKAHLPVGTGNKFLSNIFWL
jgi:hypothetical protein